VFAKLRFVLLKSRPESSARIVAGGLLELWRRAIVQSGIRPGGWRAPLMHALLFWGATGLVAATLFERSAHAGLPRPDVLCAFDPWLPLAREVSGAALALGAAMAVYRRFIRRWQRLWLDLPGDRLALGLLLVVPVSGFLLEGARLSLLPAGVEPELWLGRALAHGIVRLGLAGGATYDALRVAHVAAAAALFAAIPFTRLRHVLLAPLSILLTARAPAELAAIDGSESLPWRLRLQLAACSGCARCDEACPPALAGRPLSPMRLLLAQREDPAARAIPLAALEACTGCGACEERCPIGIAHRIRIEALRRDRVACGA
jgi:NAD-dependent dihydropyrimidine dehydrogenase PreA subunit